MRDVIGVIAAHPDDEVLGCGATIAKLALDHDVHVLILGEGITSRTQSRDDAPPSALVDLHADAHSAAAVMGVASLDLAKLPDNRFDTVPLLDVIKHVEAWTEKRRPTMLFTHHAGDLNIDHVVTARAVLTAVRPSPQNPVRELYSFEVGSSTEWAFDRFARTFRPSLFVDVAETIEVKVRAMAAYRSETRAFPHPRSPEAIRAAAARWGSVAGVSAAEAFDVIRMLR